MAVKVKIGLKNTSKSNVSIKKYIAAPRPKLPPLKARILDLIQCAGTSGISGDDLWRIAYDGRLPRYRGGRNGRNETRQRPTLKANIWQINQVLADVGWHIRAERCAGGWYYLERKHECAATEGSILQTLAQSKAARAI